MKVVLKEYSETKCLRSLKVGDTFRRFRDSDEIYIKVSSTEYLLDGHNVQRSNKSTACIAINLIKGYICEMYNETTVYPCDCVLTEI